VNGLRAMDLSLEKEGENQLSVLHELPGRLDQVSRGVDADGALGFAAQLEGEPTGGASHVQGQSLGGIEESAPVCIACQHVGIGEKIGIVAPQVG